MTPRNFDVLRTNFGDSSTPAFDEWGREESSPEDEALIAAEFLLKHESDTESAPSSVATQIFNPDTSSDEDMP